MHAKINKKKQMAKARERVVAALSRFAEHDVDDDVQVVHIHAAAVVHVGLAGIAGGTGLAEHDVDDDVDDVDDVEPISVQHLNECPKGWCSWSMFPLLPPAPFGKSRLGRGWH